MHDLFVLFRIELYSREATKSSKRISNPGCYATNTQLLLAPLMPYLDPVQMPTIFGVSGYSGAGTKSGENDSEGRPQTVPKIVSAVSQLPRLSPGRSWNRYKSFRCILTLAIGS